jgi:hypothetical protein
MRTTHGARNRRAAVVIKPRRHAMSHRLALALIAAAAVALTVPRTAPAGLAAAPPDLCDITTAERIVAVGDVHGAYEPLRAILRAASLIDERDRWIGRRAILVQTGDVLDRGPDSRRALDLLQRLEREAERAGGRVFALLGNHEVMRMLGDWRYVSDGELAAFATASSEPLRERAYTVAEQDARQGAKASGAAFSPEAFRERFLRQVPLGWIEMRQAFSPKGEYGRSLLARPVVVKVNGIIFLHGGVSPANAALGCAGINRTITAELNDPSPLPPDPETKLLTSETGPLWYRGLALEPEPSFEPALDAILASLEARAVVVGHTVTTGGRIASRFGGRVVQLDTGMLAGRLYPRGRPSALEIHGDSASAIYTDRREPVSFSLGAATTAR